MSLLDGISNEDLIKAFTREPYVTCPICGEEKAAGTCIIRHHSFTRRCFKCGGNSEGGDLPHLDKKIIYLDQMALGFMLRALLYKEGVNKEHESQISNVENFLIVFARLDVLCKKQLLICPKSEVHSTETSLVPKKDVREALKSISTLLSSTDSFLDHKRIILGQLRDHFITWLQGSSFTFDNSKARYVCYDVDHWKMWINVVINRDVTPELLEALRSEKKINNTTLALLYTKWRLEKGKTYDQFRSLELQSFGAFMVALSSMKSYELPETSSMIELILRSFFFPDQLHQISNILFGLCEKMGIQENERGKKIIEYFSSDAILEVPFFQIASAATALVAHRASQNSDMGVDGNDIQDILYMSLFLPYVDAMIMEKTWHGNLKYLPITPKAQVFSVINFPELFKYLDKIEDSASPDILEKVKEVYGDAKPYYTVHKPR